MDSPIGSDRGAGDRRTTTALAMPNRRLFLEGERVEVRLTDNGLKGSWHQGTIVKCGPLKCLVKYDDLLANDGFSKLVESIDVPLLAEGLTSEVPKNHRGKIRPLPLSQQVDRSNIRYGMCVDALIEEAWWEGVVFDHKEGSLVRTIFFPDQGDQHLFPINKLRYTYDWNEVSGEWMARSDWFLLKLLEKMSQEEPLPISVREVWYDVSCMHTFRQQIGEWIFGSQPLWHDLVFEAIGEASSVAQGQGMILNIPITESIVTPADINHTNSARHNLPNNTQLPNDDGIRVVSAQNCFMPDFSEMVLHKSFEHSNGVHTSVHSGSPSRGTKVYSKPSEDDESQEPGHSPLLDFISVQGNISHPRSQKQKELLKHARVVATRYLLSVGWKIEKNIKGCKCYFSPKGDRYYTLGSACKAWSRAEASSGLEGNCVMSNMYIHSLYNDASHCKRNCNTNSWKEVDIVAKYSPEALANLANFLKQSDSSNNSSKAHLHHGKEMMDVRGHLVALGWRIYHKTDGPVRNTKRYRYCSPDGMTFYSLTKICCYLRKTDHLQSGSDSPTEACLGSQFTGTDLHGQAARDIPKSKIFKPDHCPALREVGLLVKKYKYGTNMSSEVNQKRDEMEKHSLNLGWQFSFQGKNGLTEVPYRSPMPMEMVSLANSTKLPKMHKTEDIPSDVDGSSAKALELQCDVYNKRLIKTDLDKSAGGNCNMLQDIERLSDGRKDEGAGLLHKYLKLQDSIFVKGDKLISGESQLVKHRVRKLRKRRIENPICLQELHDVECNLLLKCDLQDQAIRKQKSCRLIHKYSDSHARKQVRKPLSPRQHSPCTILSWLIENEAVLPRQKVRYIHKEDGHVMLEGRIAHNGIKCKCCEEVHTLGKFQSHAGSEIYHPAANIFLLDGRTLWDCQRQLLEKSMDSFLPCKWTNDDDPSSQNDCICSICQEGGDLILCDNCPSSFHTTCVGLQDVPDGDWFCSSCLCSVCGFSVSGDQGKSPEATTFFCNQCERQCHECCVQKSGLSSLTFYPEGHWLCSEFCSKIFWHLRGLVGKYNPTSVEGISWVLMRSSERNVFDRDAFEKESWVEHHSMLHVALNVLHECFVSVIEPQSKTDLLEGVLFNTKSELKRLDFSGFYTMVLRKGDEIISVATFRVYGKKVAEMPFVGTQVYHRRRGMCRILMDELEKLLKSVGVERLVLPAVPQLIQTWKNSFGFSEMTYSDRLDLSSYIFLGFQGTKMCQKLLTPVSLSGKSIGNDSQMKDIVIVGSYNSGL